MRKSKLPFHKQSPLDQEATKKRLKAQEEERIDVLGQDSDLKAKYWVKKDIEQREKNDRDYFFFCIETLRKTKKKIPYTRFLTTILLHFIKQEDIPSKYVLNIDLSDQGVLLQIEKTHYYGAFKPSFIPVIDFHACKLKAIQVGNTVAKLEGYVRETAGGIILPDEEDLKKYGRTKHLS